MESIDNNSTVLGNGVHTYTTVNQVDRPSTTVAITDEVSNSDDENAANGTAVNGNGLLQSKQPSVAIYEQPIFSQSQHETTFNVSHLVKYVYSIYQR